MIKEMLNYQQKDKERLKLILNVEQGKTKRELDDNTKTLAITKNAVLSLENDAKTIEQTIETVRKNLTELLTRAEDIVNNENISQGEDELNSAVTYASTVANKIAGYESQLNDLMRRINEKATQFEDAKRKIVTVQKNIATLTPKYEAQKNELEPQLKVVEKELKSIESSVDKKLMDKYKKLRSSDKTGRDTDIVVPLISNRCAGCHFELALSMTHKISTEGYITCEECGKILFKQ
ncbi:MAG: hypothetical protein FWE01_02145 [Firmicutes bacterium]|nr:hypothetical protein [Bacillota bacterium]